MIKIKLIPLKLEYLWCLTVVAGVFIFMNTHPIRPNDFWWHITVGKEIIESQAIPQIDKFSFTMYGEPYPSYQMFWLMDVFLYLIFNLGGPALTVFVQSLIITAAYTIIINIGYLNTSSWRIAAFGGIFAITLGINDWNVRPQSITFLLGSICLWAIYSYRKNSNWKILLVLPISMLIWVNSHGTFPIGLVMIGIWFIEELWISIKSNGSVKEKKKRVITSSVALIISCLAIFVNPSGTGIFKYLMTMGGNTAIQNIVVEWAPPSINTLFGGLFFAAIIIIAIIIALSPRKPTVFEILTLLIFAILGINTSRGVIWFGLIAAPIFARYLSSIIKRVNPNAMDEISQDSLVMNRLIGGILLFLVIITLPWFKDRLPLPPIKAGLISSETPINATEFLFQKNMPVEVFHSMSFGSYLIWAAQPTYKVFVDSRIELFPPELWQDYMSISNGEDDWEELLKRYGVNTLMLSPNEQNPLIVKVSNSKNWISVYKDGISEIYKRQDSDISGVQRGLQCLVCSTQGIREGLFKDKINSP